MVSNGDRKAFKTFENLYMLDWKLLHWPCPKENVDAPFELKSKDKGKLEYGKPIGGRGRLTDTKIKN